MKQQVLHDEPANRLHHEEGSIIGALRGWARGLLRRTALVFHRKRESPSPDLSIVVVVFDMLEEAKNTLYSLSREYQREVEGFDYEVVVVDNGSRVPFPEKFLDTLSGRYRLFRIEDAAASPALALNAGVHESRAARLGILVDGARIVSPGIVAHAWKCFRAFEYPLVATLAFHIGPEVHRDAVERLDHTKEAENALLDQIEWKSHGYRLFEISSLAGANRGGWFAPMPESSCLFLPRELIDEIGGFDGRFGEPGGGLLTWDFYRRCCEHDRTELVTLLGEGTFHQMHGGAMTSTPSTESAQLLESWLTQYADLRGVPWALSSATSHYLGHFPAGSGRFIQRS